MSERGLFKRFKFWGRQQSPIQEVPAYYSRELAVREVKETVESALFAEFGSKEPRWNSTSSSVGRRWRGKLSVYPQNVHPDVSSDTMANNCSDISEELAASLWKNGFTVGRMHTKRHTYLAISYKGHEIIIDPTIAQFIEGHNHVFVGTKDQLRDLALAKSGQGFESIWGSAIRDERDPY